MMSNRERGEKIKQLNMDIAVLVEIVDDALQEARDKITSKVDELEEILSKTYE